MSTSGASTWKFFLDSFVLDALIGYIAALKLPSASSCGKLARLKKSWYVWHGQVEGGGSDLRDQRAERVAQECEAVAGLKQGIKSLGARDQPQVDTQAHPTRRSHVGPTCRLVRPLFPDSGTLHD